MTEIKTSLKEYLVLISAIIGIVITIKLTLIYINAIY
jgi:hypothetical protein